MPLDEEGAKWSCEPCIRGHRSSKCQHFDRLMMKVPKAGRPLAKCPHPQGSCSCQKLYAFMVRIPKESTCLCRPVYKVPAGAAGPALPTPPTSAPSPAPSKVQKNGKRQSSLQAAPDNIARALEFVPGFENQQNDSGQSGHLPSQPPPAIAPDNSYTPPASHLDRSTHLGPPVSLNASKDMSAPTSSCCSKPPAPTPQVPKQGSCCGKSNTSSQDDPMKSESDERSSRELNSMALPSIPSSWQDLSTAGQTHSMTAFAQQPISQSPSHFPEYNATTPSVPYTGFQHNYLPGGYDFTQNSLQPLFSGTSQSFTYTPPPATTNDTPHDCNCGDDCQCLGCATHPFNKTTKQHVQEMGALVSLDEIPNLGDFTSQPNPTFPSASAIMLDYSFANFDQQFQNPMPSYPEHTATTTGYSSPPVGYPSEQQLMEASEYYTLEYPVGLPNPCTDLSGSCQCGSDCSCVGCLTHNGHNGVSLEPAGAETLTSTAEPPAMKQKQSENNLSQIPVLDDLSVPASTPQAIEP